MRLLVLCSRTVRRRRLRSMLTILGMSVGVAAVVALLSLANGLEQSWRQIYQERSVDLIVLNGGDADYLQSRVPESLLADLRAMPEVRAADGGLLDLTAYEDIANTFISGRTPGGFLLDEMQIVEGRTLSRLPDNWTGRPESPVHPAERELLIGSAFATGRNKKVGDTVLVEQEPFHVVGIYRATSLFESGGGVVHLKALQRFELRENELSSVEVRLRRPEDFEVVRDRIEGLHPGLVCQRPSELTEQSMGLEVVEAMAWAVSGLALSIGLAGTSNTMLVSVVEQRKQIGILRALGWRRRRILGLVVGEALLLGAAALLVGCLLGAAATWGLSQVEETRNILQPRLDAWVLSRAMFCAFGLSLLSAAYPAYRASKFSPMETIRQP